MARVDAEISYFIFHLILPFSIAVCIAFYVFGMNSQKLHSVLQSRILKWMHCNYFEKDKELLFEHLHDLRLKTKGPFNILEIGVGSGLNFQYYPQGTHLTCVDPNPYNDYYWKKNLQQNKHIKLVASLHAYAEFMPQIKSNSFDVVVCTCTLCTVKDPPAVLNEVNRVLKPGGTFFFFEHVAGKRGSVTRMSQNILQKIFGYVSCGCNLNRETSTFLDSSTFRSVQYREYSQNTWIFWLFFFARPFLYGTAVK
ncbi:methyltransferase-like protein 7b [Plakobranchus ocellatus]|uniref:Methyltransferase-like protein 7b n=1 Tax=Plakobranchus ocellatus TaxID=259542 RepID=A0AAV4DTA4_9GAST|nr:methyltransferase-like protein 7b [Plakobranchus ocellatus]